MTLAIRLNCQTDGNGSSRSGWLILDYVVDNIHKNVYVWDDGSFLDPEGMLYSYYGAQVKATLRVSAHEFRRLRRECGV